jgi:hypothetical protein
MIFARDMGNYVHAMAHRWWTEHELPEGDRPEVHCGHPAWPDVVRKFQSWYNEGWRLWRSELSMYYGESAGTPDLILRKLVDEESENSPPNSLSSTPSRPNDRNERGRADEASQDISSCNDSNMGAAGGSQESMTAVRPRIPPTPGTPQTPRSSQSTTATVMESRSSTRTATQRPG